jgi:glycerate kinase
MMKIVLAFDSFKGSLTAQEACSIAEKAIRSVHPEWAVISKPMADGGEGTAQAMISSLRGRWIPVKVMGPLPRQRVRAGFAWFPSTRTALIEMAAASGLTLLRRNELNPLKTTTFGTGMLIAAAMRKGAQRIWLAVGGSATVDGGIGAAMALGWTFLDAHGREIWLGGGELKRIADIRPPRRRNIPPIDVLCDVDNPLTGTNGAARVYGPQKGATPRLVGDLEKGLWHLSRLVSERLGKQMNIPGGGAAGGLAAGAAAFLNAKLVSGADTIIGATKLNDELKDADWVITGEGCFDSQSLQGKVVSGVVRAARKQRAMVAVVAGSVDIPESRYKRAGVTTALALRPHGMSLNAAIAQSSRLLFEHVCKLARSWTS